MKKALALTARAKTDLREIRRHIEQHSLHHARLFIADPTTKLAWIAETDFTGAPRDHIRKGLRALPYRGRCIYYRSYPDRIVIVRIVHGAQDVTKLAFDKPG